MFFFSVRLIKLTERKKHFISISIFSSLMSDCMTFICTIFCFNAYLLINWIIKFQIFYNKVERCMENFSLLARVKTTFFLYWYRFSGCTQTTSKSFGPVKKFFSLLATLHVFVCWFSCAFVQWNVGNVTGEVVKFSEGFLMKKMWR